MKLYDKHERLQKRMSEIEQAQDRLESRFYLMQTEWAETLDRVTKAFNRLERANQRAASREAPAETEKPARVAVDPFSRKMALIREQTNAVPPRVDETAG